MDFAAEKIQDATSRAVSSIMARSHEQRTGESETPTDERQQSRSRYQHGPTKPDEPNPFGGDSQLVGVHANIGFAGFSRRLSGATGGGDGNNNNSQLSRFESDPKLYQGNTWDLMYFQRIMILSLLRLLIFIRKIYEDLQTTKTYGKSGNFGFFIVSSLTMLAPTIVFTLYRICRFLQQALPKLRVKSTNLNQQQQQQQRALRHNRSLSPSGNQMELDGLVTACQSPSPVSSQYVDCPSNPAAAASTTTRVNGSQNVQIKMSSTQSLPTTLSTKYPKLSPKNLNEQQPRQPDEPLTTRVVDVNKLGDLPDPESTRIVLGAGEQIVHGVLYVFWQLKRQVDVIGYLVERSCLWRKASQEELREVELLRTGSDGLEWFQDFYAAFIAIILQVYCLGVHWLHDTTIKRDSALALGDAANKLGDTSKAGDAIRNVALNTHLLQETNEDIIILSEIIVSSIAIFSLLIAVRRKDDGSLTLALSMLGWGCFFAARIIVIALSFVHLGWKLTLFFIGLHLVAITGWIYKISIDSHNDKPSETEAFIWQDEQDVIQLRRPSNEQLESGSTTANNPEQQTSIVNNNIPLNTDNWLPIEHVTLITQILTLFAIPSLFYWPVMFNLRKNFRTPMYLILILAENSLLIVGVIATIGASKLTIGQMYLLAASEAFSITGFIFIFLYLLCKPALTDYMVRADQLFNGGERAGIYFELCSRVFKMPDLTSHNFRRLMNQTEEQIEQ